MTVRHETKRERRRKLTEGIDPVPVRRAREAAWRASKSYMVHCRINERARRVHLERRP